MHRSMCYSVCCKQREEVLNLHDSVTRETRWKLYIRACVEEAVLASSHDIPLKLACNPVPGEPDFAAQKRWDATATGNDYMPYSVPPLESIDVR